MRAIVALLATLISSAASAGPRCTDAPADRWIPAEEMRSRIAATEYKVDVFKVTTGNCYEIYGRDESGKRVEVYFHPVTGDVVNKASR